MTLFHASTQIKEGQLNTRVVNEGQKITLVGEKDTDDNKENPRYKICIKVFKVQQKPLNLNFNPFIYHHYQLSLSNTS